MTKIQYGTKIIIYRIENVTHVTYVTFCWTQTSLIISASQTQSMSHKLWVIVHFWTFRSERDYFISCSLPKTRLKTFNRVFRSSENFDYIDCPKITMQSLYSEHRIFRGCRFPENNDWAWKRRKYLFLSWFIGNLIVSNFLVLIIGRSQIMFDIKMDGHLC